MLDPGLHVLSALQDETHTCPVQDLRPHPYVETHSGVLVKATERCSPDRVTRKLRCLSLSEGLLLGLLQRLKLCRHGPSPLLPSKMAERTRVLLWPAVSL